MDWIKQLIADGYKFAYVKKGARKKLWVTKDKKVTDDSIFNEFTADTDYEVAVIKALDKGVLINLLK